ncbi:MAG: ATP-binding protein [Ekhidna sp.]|nr:ATP-binding protein [Ekhidna sp.]
MKLSKFDIGAEVISILTRGMYPDPRDAVREYIQNAVDAGSKKVNVKIRQNSVVVQDDGCGMDRDTLRKALRVGISDKNPKKDVGFMGIGIYSSFHLCDRINIYSRMDDKNPYLLSMDFKGMRELLQEQKELRLNGEIDSSKLTDLQTLLEKYINLSDEEELAQDDFVLQGTRVELTGLDANFYGLLSDFEKIKAYLKEVVPLHFDRNNFKWAKEIEERIVRECHEHDANFEMIALNLQVNGQIEDLYRPYSNGDFHNNSPQKPHFELLKKGQTFIGIVWGCLNSTRNKISTGELRGFLLKKQGFAIGKRENLVSYFGQRTHFDRYIGEVIIVNTNLLPNASRNDLEYSPLRTMFFSCLKDAGSNYNSRSTRFQESDKASVEISEYTNKVKGINGAYSSYSENTEELVNYIIDLEGIRKKVESILKRKSFGKDTEKEKEAKELKNLTDSLKKEIQGTIDSLITKKKKKRSRRSVSQTEIAKGLSKIDTSSADTSKYESLIDLLKSLDIELTKELEDIFSLLDESFIEHYSENPKQYQSILRELKTKISDLII